MNLLANKEQSMLKRGETEVLVRFHAAGPGWRTRIDAALRKAPGL